MRTAFFNTLLELAQDDPRIMLIVGDLGFGATNKYVEQLPRQFLNAGVAEQNMTGLAAGMAINGRIAFTYSIANFPVLRCLEQIRNDVCYHNANVKIVSVGGGMTYGSLGASHFATEDIAILRTLPNMVVIAPGDPFEVTAAVRAAVKYDGPCYIRLGRDKEPRVHRDASVLQDFQFGQAILVRPGSDLTLISTGGLLVETVAAADLLRERGVHAGVLSMPTVKPIDVNAILKAAFETHAIVTVEEHSTIGGLGSAVAEVLAEAGIGGNRFQRIGLPDQFRSRVGDQFYLRSQMGLDRNGILSKVESFLSQTQ
jgi:transketolase